MQIKLVYIVLISLLGLLGCSKKETEVQRAYRDGILLVGIGPDPEGLDPHCISGVTEQNVLRSLFEGLVKPHPKTLEPEPGVAERWTVSTDGLRYTFYLRPNATWSNGDKIEAEDFLFSFQRLLTPAVGASGATSFFVIKNAKQFYNNELSFDKVGIKVLDALTLEFTLESPTAYFLSLLMQAAAYPVHRETLKRCNGEFTRDPTWTRVQDFVGNGPFVLKHWKVGEKIELAKNKLYWNESCVKLNGIVFKPISDHATEERAFRRGQLHITENVPYSKIKEYYQKKDEQLKIHPYLGTFYYIFNTKIKPLDDVRVRKALNLALHRDALMGNDLFCIKHRSAFQLVPEDCCGFHCINPIEEDADLARKLLAEAGYPNGQNFPKLSLIFNTTEGQMYLASAIQEMWKKELNIDVETINLEWKVYLNRRREKNFEIARGGWVGDYNDPTTFLDLWRSNSYNNYTYWHNDVFDHLLDTAANMNDVSECMHTLQKAEALILDEVPLLPLHSSATSHLVHPSVQNWHTNLLDWHPYDCIYLE